jgi:hypothetical protein
MVGLARRKSVSFSKLTGLFLLKKGQFPDVRQLDQLTNDFVSNFAPNIRVV